MISIQRVKQIVAAAAIVAVPLTVNAELTKLEESALRNVDGQVSLNPWVRFKVRRTNEGPTVTTTRRGGRPKPIRDRLRGPIPSLGGRHGLLGGRNGLLGGLRPHLLGGPLGFLPVYVWVGVRDVPMAVGPAFNDVVKLTNIGPTIRPFFRPIMFIGPVPVGPILPFFYPTIGLVDTPFSVGPVLFELYDPIDLTNIGIGPKIGLFDTPFSIGPSLIEIYDPLDLTNIGIGGGIFDTPFSIGPAIVDFPRDYIDMLVPFDGIIKGAIGLGGFLGGGSVIGSALGLGVQNGLFELPTIDIQLPELQPITP